MIRLHRPTEAEVAALIESPGLAFSYPEVGATANRRSLDALPRSYVIDRRRFQLGTGRPLFEQARTALLAWRHFEIPWLELQTAGDRVHAGQAVATSTCILGVWFVNPCRVVDCIDESTTSDRVAFAYGTLTGHVEAGEERFSVDHDRETDEVCFEILAFSRPAMLLTQLGYPWVRRIQKRFAGSAAEALGRACGLGGGVMELRRGHREHAPNTAERFQGKE